LKLRNPSAGSGKDRTNIGEPTCVPIRTSKPPTGAMSDGNRTQAEPESSRGNPQTLLEVLDPANLSAAWKQVRANGGVEGIDGMKIGDFPAFMREHWDTIRGKLEDGTYSPSPVRRVEIPKTEEACASSAYRRCSTV